MATSDDDDTQQPSLTGEFEIQQINNRVLGFPPKTTPILTPEKDCQVLAFGTLEALLTSIQRYNEAYATIQSTPQLDDPHSATPELVSLITAGNDIKTVGAYLRCVELLDEQWNSSPGVQLLLGLDTATDPASIALQARGKRRNELRKQREAARKKALYELTEKARKEKLDKAIREGIKIMMSFHTRGRDSSTATSSESLAEVKDEPATDLEIQNSSQPMTVESLESDDDEPPVSANGSRAKKATAAAPVKPKTTNPSSSSQRIPYQGVVVEVPSPESLKGGKRKKAQEPSNKPELPPKRTRLVDKLVL
ncbi:uncharacterized protein TRUGW13939_08369 [Talaromyces rugulosus]|uniref:Uncharacterized protein n=1 Tax=Talaromyces rugulosus TaxID=121627 RepID=A0A7H8R4F5_TALRU|nr:uncharacterized protein TRUGW13939_08369 [Talaromyces rugulosus]QKX61222.1 hypothetical protein TRUGW13939_08369 [Talaromyces rugulosus]